MTQKRSQGSILATHRLRSILPMLQCSPLWKNTCCCNNTVLTTCTTWPRHTDFIIIRKATLE